MKDGETKVIRIKDRTDVWAHILGWRHIEEQIARRAANGRRVRPAVKKETTKS